MTRGARMGRWAVAGALAALALTGQAARGQDTSPAPPASESPVTEPAPAAPAPAEGASAPAGLATLPETLAGAAGTWDLSLAGGNRRCVLTLATDTGPSGRVVRFPAGCRRALPLMAGITGWLFPGEGIRLVDRNARPLLAFSRNPDGMSLGATSENGERYNLVPLQIAAMRPPDPAAGAGSPAPASSTEAAAPPPPPEGPAPGLYALDRATQKDVCRIELAGSAGTDRGAAPVRLQPDCRDSGITVFDPVSWRFANGHLTLKARRGHAVNLVATGDGRWRRDPEIGVAFVLRKVEP